MERDQLIILSRDPLTAGTMIHRGRDLDGHKVALASSAALTLMMGARFARTKKMLPGGTLMTTLINTSSH